MFKRKKKKFGILQQEQIDLGKKHGLSNKQVHIYAKEKYDFLQMQEMRLALEEGMHPLKVRLFFTSRKTHEVMEKLRESEKDEVVEPVPYFVAISCAVVIVICIIGALFVYMHFEPDFLLKESVIYIRKGERINPLSYIDEEFKDKVEIIEKQKENGNHVVVYHTDEIYRILHVEQYEE